MGTPKNTDYKEPAKSIKINKAYKNIHKILLGTLNKYSEFLVGCDNSVKIEQVRKLLLDIIKKFIDLDDDGGSSLPDFPAVPTEMSEVPSIIIHRERVPVAIEV